MKTTRPVLSAMLLGLGMLAFSATASARDHGDRHHGYEHHHDHYDQRYGRDVQIVERRYVVREAPRRYYEPVYERRAPIYREEPGVVVRIGLPLPPPIFFPFN